MTKKTWKRTWVKEETEMLMITWTEIKKDLDHLMCRDIVSGWCFVD